MRVLAKCLLVKSPINSATVWRVTVEGGEVHNYLCVKNSLTVEKQLWREHCVFGGLLQTGRLNKTSLFGFSEAGLEYEVEEINCVN